MKVISFILSFFSCLVFGQNNFFYLHYTSDEGLPVNTIYDIKESPSGVITIASSGGISFFDGVKFKNINTKNGLDKPGVVGLQYYKNGDLYIGNYNGKLQKYNDGKISTLPYSCNTVDEIFVKDHQYISKAYSANNINGKLKLAVQYYIYHKNKPNEIKNLRERQPLDYDEYYKKYVIDRPYIIHLGYESILVNDRIEDPKNPITIPKEIPKIYIIKKRKNDWALFTQNFVFLVDFYGKITQKIALPFPLLDGNNRFHAEIDKENQIWLNLQKRGLFIYRFGKWTPISSYLNLEINQNINRLFKDSKNSMWIATHENGLFCIPNTDVLQYFTPENNDYFNSFFTYNQQLYTCNRYALFAVKPHGLEKIPIPNKVEFKLGYFENQPSLMGFHPDYHLKKINQKWMAIRSREYTKIGENEYVFYTPQEVKYHKNKIETYFIPKDNTERFYSIIFHKNKIYVNNSKEIYTAKVKDTILINQSKPITYKQLVRIKTIYNSDGYMADMVFKNDTLLIAENNALLYFKDKIHKKIEEVNDYHFEKINQIILDENEIWLATIKGLVRVNKPLVLNKHNYLSNNDVMAFTKDDQYIYVATINGMNKIPLAILQKKNQAPVLEMSNYLSTEWQPIQNKKIILKYDENNLNIPLKITNYLSPKNQIIQYRFRKSNWVNVTDYEINLLNIPYGISVLECRIKDVNSDWYTTQIRVEKAWPFYLTLWFFVLMILLIFGIFFMIFNARVRKIKREKQKEISQAEKVVELRQSALSAQMNPHFVFNSLNAIQYFVNSNQKEKSSEYLAKLSRLVRMFLNHASEPYISLSEEIKRLQLYVNLEQLRFDHFDCEFHYTHIQNLQKIMIPNMILQPFIENAILHGVSHLTSKDGRIQIQFQQTQNLLTISIEDNGFGLKTNEDRNSHISKGLGIIEERIHILQESHPEKTYSLTYEIPHPDQERKGHRVIIQLTIDF